MNATDRLQTLLDAGVFEPVDVHFARALEELAPGQSDAVLLGAAFASRAVGHGHVCADIERLVSTPLLDGDGNPLRGVTLPHKFEWTIALSESPLCGPGDRPTPLVFDGGARLYLTRYWRYQTALARALGDRAQRVIEDIDGDRLRDSLSRLFPGDATVATDRQRLAAAVAAVRGLTVISGGPGTGKTSTVVRILAALAEQALGADRPPPRIDLLAPTGKAAARLVESILAQRDTLSCTAAIKDAIPTSASTIHRRLGFRPGTPTRFHHDETNPLVADVVVVDEASMIDLALMAKLAAAVPRSARLILLGDRDQLASVEAGAILGDICNADERPPPSVAMVEQIESLVGVGPQRALEAPATPTMGDCIVHLARSYRFSDSGGIGALARAITAGDAAGATTLLGSTEETAVGLTALAEGDDPTEILRPLVVSALGDLAPGLEPAQRLEALGRFRLLCAHRRGPFGVERINRVVERILRDAGVIRADGPWYDGRPILVTQNDYQLDLFNGDVGIIGRDPRGRLRAHFPAADGTVRSFVPGRLPPHETVYAMTVHKSQGSEFDHVAVLMPDAVSPILTRELVYTAVTRARESVRIIGSEAVVRGAIGRRIERASGLREALWG